MKLIWRITPSDASKTKQFVTKHQNDPFVQHRIKRNLGKARHPTTKGIFWRVLVGCLLTTQQRSGPDGAVARFMRLSPFPLRYSQCRSERNLAKLATRTLASFGGIRRSEKIGGELTVNLRCLEGGLWDDILPRLETLRTSPTPAKEVATAEYLAETLIGVGPKQSRNLLQILGLTRFEVPIDSRLTRWLNDFGYPIRLSSIPLSDPHYYNFVSRGIQALCAAAGVYPCVLDAAIFASRDGGSWRADNLENWAIDD